MDIVTLALAKSYIDKKINEEGTVTGATPQQAAQIEQNKTDIADLQTEIDELKESSGGSVDLTGVVRSVNGKTPDEKGNVEIDVSGSGENVELDTTLTQSGKAADAKAVGDALAKLEDKIPENSGTTDYTALTNKPKINGVTLEGNKTAEELGMTGLTDEQVRTALDGYIADNPDAIVTGATPEQVAQIEFANAADAALFATLETGSLYEVSLDGWSWYDGRMLAYDTIPGVWKSDFSVAGNRYSIYGCIHLRQGDVLITNADAPVHGFTAERVGCVLQKMTAYVSNYNQGTFLMEGRGAYDGLYRCYTATDAEEYIRVAYQYDVDYDVHFYVAKARADAEVIPYTYVSGYIKANTGEVYEASTTDRFVPGYNSEVVSQLITLSAPGQFLLVKNASLANSKGAYVWAKYAEDGSFVYGLLKDRWGTQRDYFIVPLFEDTEYIRLNYMMDRNPYHLTEALLVDAEYLMRNGYADKLAGKKLVGFGDSYIQGHNIGINNTALYRIAEEHQMQYTAFGHNGWGICRGPLTPTTLADIITEELAGLDTDYIIVWAGRNDYSSQAPIGTNDDMADMSVNYLSRTFKGSLNYICNFLVENYPDKKVAFFTPWYFPSTLTEGETHKPVEYIDAIKEVCGLWGIPVFDCARDSGIHVKSEAFRSRYFLGADDVSHLKWDGACLFADGPADDWLMLL